MYSDWLKIDLHIHTDKSKETKEGDYKGTFSIAVLKQKLIENKVEIFSLTDHNIINIEAYREYYDSYNSDTDPLLLLGVELDLQGESKIFHTLIIFNATDLSSTERISQILEDTYTAKGIIDKSKRILDFSDIAINFKDEDFFFIPHADGEKNIVKAYAGDIETAQRMVLLMPSALEKVTKEERIKHYNDGFDFLCSSSFQQRKDIAYINFSDNHNCAAYPCAHMGQNGLHSFYYIKGIKSYESIRLAFIDPQCRIKSTEQFNNDIDKARLTIDKIKIEGESNIDNVELTFSPHLNVIIGGRSSGKSLLMWLIGKKINEAQVVESKYKFDPGTVSIRSSASSNLQEEISIGNHLLYLRQGDIIRYFEEKQLNTLAQQAGKIDEYSNAGKEITELKPILQTKLNQLKCAYQDIQDRCKTTLFVISDKQILEATNSDISIFQYDKTIIEKTYNTEEKEEVKSIIKNVINNINTTLNHNLIRFNTEEIDRIKQVIEIYRQKLKDIELAIANDTKKSLFSAKVENIVLETNKSQAQETKLKQESLSAIDTLVNDISQRFKLYKHLKDCTTDVENFHYSQKVKIPIITGIELIREVKEVTSIKSSILDGLKGSDESDSLYINIYKLLNGDISIKNYPSTELEYFSKKIDKEINENIVSNIENPIDYLQYEDGETSEGRSPGYNSEQYLKIILSTPSLTTIFIDQPEDNLGNKYIADELVAQIRKIKFSKQLFLVTHNPSIVVYGDAENVILAENNENHIKYKQLVLEDLTAQKQICDTLDGGKYIFHNRYQKYNIHRLLHKNKES